MINIGEKSIQCSYNGTLSGFDIRGTINTDLDNNIHTIWGELSQNEEIICRFNYNAKYDKFNKRFETSKESIEVDSVISKIISLIKINYNG